MDFAAGVYQSLYKKTGDTGSQVGIFIYLFIKSDHDCMCVHALLSVSCQVSAKFGACTVVGLNGTLDEAKMSHST
jgi:hypothetical protein